MGESNGAYLGLRDNNNMTKMLALTPDEMQAIDVHAGGLGSASTSSCAKEALAGIDAVGLQDRFEALCAQLTHRFGWDLGEPEVINASPTGGRAREPACANSRG